MALACFEITAPRAESKQVDKITTYAGVYFSIKVNGQEQALAGSVYLEYKPADLCVFIGSSYNHEISSQALYLTHYGLTMARNAAQSERLVRWKPHLEEALRQAAAKLLAEQPRALPALSTKDLLTGALLPAAAPTESKISVEYAFVEPTIERVAEAVAVPGRIWFSCVVPPPADEAVVGRAGGLTVRFGRSLGSGFDGAQLWFSWPGWVCSGDAVANLRAKFPNSTIEAAFKDLAQQLVALDATPEDARRWSGVATTKVQLV